MPKSSWIVVLCFAFLFNIDKINNYNIIKPEDNYLSIPQIDLKKRIYEIGSFENNVDINVELIKNDINNFVLAGHNGNTYTAYFKNLDKLQYGDLIYFNYNNVLRIYELNKIYEINKNGYFKVEKYLFPVINLVTCKKNSDTLQVVYVGYLLK